MADKWLVVAGLGGFAGVGLGAASTHMTHGNAHAAQLIATAADFLLFHSLALTGVAILERQGTHRILTLAGLLFATGASAFAGGLTALASDDAFQAVWIVPVGGILMLSGWLALAVYGAISRR
jgi:uncharacterized membrane protein YgdD (TMEM256/DUF423 family)